MYALRVSMGAGRQKDKLAAEEDGLDEAEVGLGVDADGVEIGGLDVDGEAVFEEAELFEALGALQPAGGQGGEAVEGGLAIGVEADVLPVKGWWFESRRRFLRQAQDRLFDSARCAPLRMTISRCIAVVWDGGAGEVERPAVGGGDHLDGVGIGDVLRSAGDLEGGDGGGGIWEGVGEGAKQSGDVFGTEQRLVALDVDVDFGVDELGDSVNAVGAAGQIGRGELDGEAELAAESDDFFGVSSDDDLVELRAGAGGVDNPGEQRATGDLAKDLARQAGGGETSGNDAEGTHSSLRYRIGRQVHRVC